MAIDFRKVPDLHPDCHPARWLDASSLHDLQHRVHSQRMLDLIALCELGLAVGVTIDTAAAIKSLASAEDVAKEISEALALRRATAN